MSKGDLARLLVEALKHGSRSDGWIDDVTLREVLIDGGFDLLDAAEYMLEHATVEKK